LPKSPYSHLDQNFAIILFTDEEMQPITDYQLNRVLKDVDLKSVGCRAGNVISHFYKEYLYFVGIIQKDMANPLDVEKFKHTLKNLYKKCKKLNVSNIAFLQIENSSWNVIKQLIDKTFAGPDINYVYCKRVEEKEATIKDGGKNI